MPDVLNDQRAVAVLTSANARQSHLVRELRQQTDELLAVAEKAAIALTTDDPMPAEQCRRIADMLRKARRIR